MQKALILTIALVVLIFHWACSDNNNSPSKPTATFGVASPSPTVLVQGTPGTPTPIPTFALPAPVFQYNYSTAISPNGMVITGNNLTIAEYGVTMGGALGLVEGFKIVPANGTITNALNPDETGYVLQGFPTPESTPPWQPVTTALNGPQGFVNPGGGGGYAYILDDQPSGGAILYWGNSGMPGWGNPYFLGFLYEPYQTAGYDSKGFNRPKGMTADSLGTIYIADTGNGCVEEFGNAWGCGLCPLHRWYGWAGVPFGTFTSVVFKSPYGIACDASNNVWVTDVGYSPSMIQEFASQGTTIINAFSTIPGCVAQGIAVNSTTGNIYIADSGNHLVEVYSPSGTILTEWGDPGPAAHESVPFSPSCIAFTGTYAFVGDNANNFIDVFQ